MASLLHSLNQQLDQASDPQRRATSTRFFKTTAGSYAEGEQFMGISVPILRTIAKHYQYLSFTDLTTLLNTAFNEKRLLALFILVLQYKHAYKQFNPDIQEEIFHFFLNHRHRVNNWNLVDSSAPYIIGAHLWDKDRRLLLSLAASPNLWDRRIAIVATWFFIRQGDLDFTLNLATLLLKDPQDLMHKATGWMLREVGKKDQNVLINFLNSHASHMPRTMLRTAIEKFSAPVRASYLLKVLEQF